MALLNNILDFSSPVIGSSVYSKSLEAIYTQKYMQNKEIVNKKKLKITQKSEYITVYIFIQYNNIWLYSIIYFAHSTTVFITQFTFS